MAATSTNRACTACTRAGAGIGCRCDTGARLSCAFVVVAGLGRCGSTASGGAGRADRVGGRCAGVVRPGRFRLRHSVLAATQRRSAAGAGGRRARCVLGAVGMGCTPAALDTGHHASSGSCRAGLAQRVGHCGGGPVMAKPWRPLGITGCVAVESAGHIGLGLTWWGIADEFPDHRGEFGGRRPASEPGCVGSHCRSRRGAGVRCDRPGLVPAGTGTCGRPDGTGGAGPGRQHRRLRGS